MLRLSETYYRGVAERKEWLKAHPGRSWSDAIEAWNTKRLAETAQATAGEQRFEENLAAIRSTSAAPAQPVVEAATVVVTPIQETAPDEPPVPLHTLSNAEFAQHASQHWNGVFERLQGARSVTGAPFFAGGWDSPLTPKGDAA